MDLGFDSCVALPSASMQSSQVLKCICMYMPQPFDSEGPPYPSPLRVFLCWLRWALSPSPTSNFDFEAVCDASSKGLRNPYGLYISLCTLHLYCLGFREKNIYIFFLAFRHKRNTRYGWLVRPYPTGTCTLQDASRLNLTL